MEMYEKRYQEFVRLVPKTFEIRRYYTVIVASIKYGCVHIEISTELSSKQKSCNLVVNSATMSEEIGNVPFSHTLFVLEMLLDKCELGHMKHIIFNGCSPLRDDYGVRYIGDI